MNKETNKPFVKTLEIGSRVSLFVGVISHEAYNLKGNVTELRDVYDDERQACDDLRKQMYSLYGELGIPENLAEKYQISRQEQEAFALTSQTRASEARSAGRLKSEIIPVETNEGIVDEDACLRPETTLDGLSSLEPAFDAEGSVTAGTSSPLTDGAAAVLVCTEAFAQNQNLKPIALLKSIGVSGVSPQIMGIGPVQATEKALERASLKMEDLDIIELNEAFAVQALACTRELPFDSSKINIDGGAIAIGHPIGASGTRILVTLLHQMKKQDAKKGLATLCIGGGMGIALCVER